jgi:hypothetical protein
MRITLTQYNELHKVMNKDYLNLLSIHEFGTRDDKNKFLALKQKILDLAKFLSNIYSNFLNLVIVYKDQKLEDFNLWINSPKKKKNKAAIITLQLMYLSW